MAYHDTNCERGGRQVIKPSTYNSWFLGDLPDGSSTVLAVTAYTGHYPEHFTHVLRLVAPRTARGWIEEAVNLRK